MARGVRASALVVAAVLIAWPAVRNGWVDYDEAYYSRGTFLLLRSLAPGNLARLMTSAGPGYQRLRRLIRRICHASS